MAEPARIQKVLAEAGVASRRAAEELVAAGRVTVNGQPAVIGQKVDSDADRIVVDGRPLRARPTQVWLALHKPAGVTSTVADRHAPATVLDLVPADVRRAAKRLYPVGRLDQDSEGLLLLTNDGDWAQHVLHPRYEVEREYAIGLAEPLTREQAQELQAGIPLEEGRATLAGLRPASGVETARMEELAGRSRHRLTWYRATLTQGWKRQLRRMFAAVGAPVERLVRVRIGTLRLDVRSGEVRPLSAAERDRLVGGSRPGRTTSSATAPAPAAVPTPAAGAAPRGRRKVRVSIDGPGSSGKSSVGAEAATRLGYRFCDTGVLYRGLAWLAAERGTDPDDSAALVALIPELALAEDDKRQLAQVVVGGRDVTDELHQERVDRLVSAVAADAGVRAALLPVQRDLAKDGGIVMAGRDIGTVVLPDAEVRLWLDVSLEVRAARRARQRGLDPASPEGQVILEDLRRRDEIDSSRAAAPLRIPDGAVIIHADDLTFDRTVTAVIDAIRAAERGAGPATGRPR
ncbi:MAG: (d)CMP kinase [Chloroflexota bacterium]